MRTILEDDGSPPQLTIGNREREEIATQAMRWAVPLGFKAAGICSVLAFLGAVFVPEKGDLPLTVVVGFHFIAWPLGLFIWKRGRLREKAQADLDVLNLIEREKWQNSKTRSTGSAVIPK